MGSLRYSSAGESHGPAIVCIVEGVPAGLPLSAEHIQQDLARRQRGYGRGARMAIETDEVRFLAGLRHGITLGSPLAMLVANRDHENWRPCMQPEALADDITYEATDSIFKRVTIPRPGHADLAGIAKYRHTDIRNVLERASARETVARVAAGAVARSLLAALGVTVAGRVVSLGPVKDRSAVDWNDPCSVDWQQVETSPFGVSNAEVEAMMKAVVDEAASEGETLGGVFEIWAWGVVPGLGSYQTPWDRLDGRLMAAVGSIQAIKGVEVGLGFDCASAPGSRVHDPIERALVQGHWVVTRSSNNAGGLEGGVTNGQPIIIRAAMKPIPTLAKPLPSVDLATMEPAPAHKERSDVTAVPAARVVGEAMVAFVLASAYVEKFGGDRLEDLKAAVSRYEEELQEKGLWSRQSR